MPANFNAKRFLVDPVVFSTNLSFMKACSVYSEGEAGGILTCNFFRNFRNVRTIWPDQ